MYEFYRKRSSTLRIVGIYALVSLLWIYASDTVLGWLAPDPQIMVQIAIYKGTFFVLLTSLLLYFLMRRYNSSLSEADLALRDRVRSLLKSEERLSLALIVTNTGIWDWNLETGEVFFEANYFNLAGYQADEFPHKYEEWEKRVHPADIGPAKAAVKAYLTGAAPAYAAEFRFKAKDGSWIWILGQGKIFDRNEHGEPVRFAGTHTDITSQKKAEEERQRAEQARRESEEHYRTILQTAMDGVFLTDAEGRLLEVNEAYCRMSGYSKQELLTMRIPDLEGMESDRETAARLKKIKAHGEDRFETRHLRKDGSFFEVEVSVQYRPSNGGRLVAFLRDVTERKLGEFEREQTVRLVHLANTPGELRACMSELTAFIQDWAGCEAVGIRLREGDDFPYYQSAGFSADFLETENGLCAYDSDGEMLRDCQGNPVLECMCGGILSGRFDSGKPFFTAHGSFWSNSTTALLAGAAEADLPARTRNRCHGAGYESVALIPLHDGEGVFGLLQFNDRRPDRFSPAIIELFERMADSLALSLARRRAEEELREQEQFTRATIDGLSANICVIDGEGKIVITNRSWNRFAEENHAAKDSYAEGVNYLDACKLLSADDKDVCEFVSGITSVMAGAVPEFVSEYPCHSPEVERWFVCKVNRFEVSGALYVVISHEDITTRKLAEMALVQSQTLLDGIIDSTNDMIWSVDPVSFGLCSCNNSLREYFLARRGILLEIGMRPQDVFEADEHVQLWNGYYRRALEEGPFTVEYDSFTGVNVLELRFSLLKLNEEVCGVSVFGKDVTERKRAEEALQESENRLRFALAGANDGIWDVQMKTGRTYLSPRGCEILGYREDEVDQLVALWPDLVHPDDLQPAKDRLQAHLDGLADNFEIEQRLRTKSGDWKWILTRGKVAERAPDGAPLRMTGTHSDLTGQKKLEAQLQQAQKMESVGILAGGVAHDFNNMLSVILGHTFLAISESDPAQLQSSLEEIRKAAERSADLTRQLLAFARKQTIAPVVLDLNETVTGMLTMLQRLIGEGISLHWQPEQTLWWVKMDPSQIDQILANLCVNARDSITDVGKVTIETGKRVIDENYASQHLGCQPGEYLSLSVADNGSGMDRETLAHIFEPFFTTKGVGKGTGLGLSTVYGIVKQNNGFIDVYSEPGLGTTFTIYLPRYLGKGARARSEDASQPPPRGQETILLVEDEPAILNMAAMMLARLGYLVLAANSPSEAIRKAKGHDGEIRLVVTDVIMPEMNGKELAKNLTFSYPQLKTLFMSGYTADAIAHHGVLDEGVHFIQKPFSLPGLGGKVREVLDS